MRFLFLNEQQLKVIGKAMFGSTGLVIWILTKKFGLSDEEARMYVDALLVIFPIIATAWIAAGQTTAAQIQNVTQIPLEEKARVISELPKPDVEKIAAALPEAVVITAAGSYQGVEVKVGDDASDSAKAVANDENAPGVSPA